MQLTKSLWMSAVLSAGLFGAIPHAGAASNPATAQIRFNCASQACNALSGTFAGRLDWYSGNVLLFSESGTFSALANKDLAITLSGNGSGATFQSTYVDSATSILDAPDLTVKVYGTAGGDVLLLSQPYQPQASALWAKHSEDATAETTRAMAAESTLNTALSIEVGKRATGLSNETSRATSAESALQSSLDNEIAARKAADATLTSSVANEATRAQGAEAALSSNLASESSTRAAADNSLLAQINSVIASLQSEIASRISGDNSLTNSIQNEASNRAAGENNLQNSINNEINRAQNAEASALASAKSYTDTKTPWPQSCKVNQIIQMTANGWACADPATGSTAGFPSSSIVSTTQGAQVNTWIGSPTQLWKLCYSRNVDGASSSTFHTKCDNQGPAVTLIKADNGFVWGGYSSPAWNSNNNYFGDNTTFLFTVTNNGKLPFGTGAGGTGPYEMYGNSSYGPTFGGGHDMHIDSNMTTGYCNAGYSYGCHAGSYGSAQCQNDLCGSYSSWNATSIEVWIKDAGGGGGGGGLSIQVEGHANVTVPCVTGDYSCEAHYVCNAVTNSQCIFQQYDCATGTSGSWYPPDGSSGSSNFNFAYAYDLSGGNYGNICACNQSQMTRYGLASNHSGCGYGHWVRQ